MPLIISAWAACGAGDTRRTLLPPLGISLIVDVREGILKSLDHGTRVSEATAHQRPMANQLKHPEFALSSASAPPEQVGGYRLLEHLSSAPDYTTWRAEDSRLGRSVVLKIAATDAPGQLSLLQQGARNVAALREPGVAPILSTGDEEGWAYVARAHVPGSSLDELLKQKHLSPEQSRDIAVQLAETVAKLHRQGLAHGGLSAANVIRNSSGQLVLVDFRGGDPGALRAADVNGLGRLFRELLSETNAPDEARLDRVLRVAADFQGPAAPDIAEKFVAALRAALGLKVAAAPDHARGRARARGLRTTLMVIGGAMLLLLSFVMTIGFAVHGFNQGWGHAGMLMLIMLLMVAPVFLRGIFLLRAAIYPPTSDPRSQNYEPGTAPASAEIPTVIGENAPYADGPDDDSSELESMLINVPANADLQVTYRAGKIRIAHVTGRMTARIILLASVFLFLLGIGLAWVSTPPINQFTTALPLLIGIVCLCIALSAIVWSLQRFVVRGGRSPRDSIMGRILGVISDIAFDRPEALQLGDDALVYHGRATGRAGRRTPWQDVWDVKPGSGESGIEVATLGKPVTFAPGLSPQARDWVSQFVRLFHARIKQRRDSSTADQKSAHADELLLSDASVRHETIEISRGLSWSIMFCVVMFPLLAVVEFVFDRFSPLAFAINPGMLPMEHAINVMAAMIMLATTAFYVIGLIRLRSLRRSGVALIRTAFWLRTSCFLAMYFGMKLVGMLGIPSDPRLTFAVNMSAVAHSIQIIMGMLLVLWLHLRMERLPLRSD